LVPVDAQLASASEINRELIGLDAVLFQMQAASTRLVFLDASRDAPLIKTARLRITGGARPPDIRAGFAAMEGEDGTLIL